MQGACNEGQCAELSSFWEPCIYKPIPGTCAALQNCPRVPNNKMGLPRRAAPGSSKGQEAVVDERWRPEAVVPVKMGEEEVSHTPQGQLQACQLVHCALACTLELLDHL